MVRTVKAVEHAAKRNDILDGAQRLITAKGYERMTIQDILADLKISKGAFYHYFDSKQGVLEALVSRLLDEAEEVLVPIASDARHGALEKLQRFFTALLRWKSGQRMFVAEVVRVWFTDENALVRHKVDALTLQRLSPLLTAIIHQGCQEGVFTPSQPDLAGTVILSLIRGLQDTLAEQQLADGQRRADPAFAAGIVAAYAAYFEAIERMLGVADAALGRLDGNDVQAWLVALTVNG